MSNAAATSFPFLKIAIIHNVSYGEVVRLADLIEHEGQIRYDEINEISEPMIRLIGAVHEVVAAEQVRRGIIKFGENTKIIPRQRGNKK